MRRGLMGLVLVLALALAACGGGDDENGAEPRPQAAAEQSADERQVRAVVTEALKTTDPDACTRLLTQTAVERFTFQRGRKAIAECRDDADDVAAKTVAIGRVEVTGAHAEVDVEPEGGSLTLKTATFELRKDGGRWKIDRLTAGTLDRPAFFREAGEDLRKENDGLPPGVADCVLRDLKNRENAEIMRLYLGSDWRVILVPTVICALRSELGRSPGSSAIADCVTRGVRRELSTGALGRELARNANPDVLESRRFEQVLQQIAAQCAQTQPA